MPKREREQLERFQAGSGLGTNGRFRISSFSVLVSDGAAFYNPENT
jgi:hypothetical protein